MKPNTFKNVFFLLILCCFMSCKEEDDFISHPTATSTFIKGVARTSNGEPLANVKVSLDYTENVWLGPQLTRHKAEGTTDANGNYQLYFDLKDEELNEDQESNNVAKNFVLNFNLENLSRDSYILPTDINPNDKYDWVSYHIGNHNLERSKTYEQNLYIPRKSWVEVTVINKQILGVNDVFAITNSIAYGGDSRPDNIQGEGSLTLMQCPIQLTSKEVQTFRIPCALNDSNRITLACMEGGSGWYEPASSMAKIFVTKDAPKSVKVENNIFPSQFKFKLKSSSNQIFISPFELVSFKMTDLNGKWSMIETPSFCSYYDSVVWSADGYPDQKTVYRKVKSPYIDYVPEWECRFSQNKSLYTRLQGYKDGRVVYTDSVQTRIMSRDFLNIDWGNADITLNNWSYVCSCPLDQSIAFRHYKAAELDGHLYSRLLLEPQKNENKDTKFAERAKEALSKLMDEHLGTRRSFNPETIGGSFYCLKAGVKPLFYWQTEATRALLVEADGVEAGSQEIYVHAEPFPGK